MVLSLSQQRKGKVKRQPRWMTKWAELARRNKYHTWYRETTEYHLYEAYKCQCNIVQNEVKKVKWYFETNIADNVKPDPKSCYVYTTAKTRTQDSVGLLVNRTGESDHRLVWDSKFTKLATLAQYSLTRKWTIYLILSRFSKKRTLEESLQNIKFTTAVMQENFQKNDTKQSSWNRQLKFLSVKRCGFIYCLSIMWDIQRKWEKSQWIRKGQILHPWDIQN